MRIAQTKYINLFRPRKKIDCYSWISENVPDYNFALTPYFRAIASDFSNPVILSILVYKSAQIGFTHFMYSCLAFHQANIKDNSLIVLPTKEKIIEENNTKIYPLLSSIKSLQIIEKRNSQIKLPGSYVWFGSGENSKTLKSKSVGLLLFDEIEEFPQNVEGEGDPIGMAVARTITRPNHKIIYGSTPRHEKGHLARLYKQATDKRVYYCQCPKCGHWQAPVWEQLKWADFGDIDHQEQAAEIESNEKLCWYSCLNCKSKLYEADKKKMVAGGQWVSQTQRIENDRVIGDRPLGGAVAYTVTAMLSLWYPWHRLAAGWLRTHRDSQQRKAYLSQYLGRTPEKERLVATTPAGVSRTATLKEQSASYEPGQLPNWRHAVLTIGVDFQKDSYVYVVRFHGRVISRLIEYGITNSQDELLTRLNKQYPIVSGGSLMPSILCIDFGGYYDLNSERNAKETIFRFAEKDKRIMPVKGLGNNFKGGRLVIENNEPTYGRSYLAVQSNWLAERLVHRMADGNWQVHNKIDKDYISQIDSISFHQDEGQNVIYKFAGANHYFDAEIYSAAGAIYMGSDEFQDESESHVSPQSKPADMRALFSKLRPSTSLKKW